MRMVDPLRAEVESQLQQLGFELVEMERAGPKARPILRLRIDRPEGAEVTGITLDDCVAVSRSLEERLDQRDDLSERYVLEVSSPGVERPLVRPADFTRFAGREVAVQSRTPIHKGAKRVEGELIGIEQGESGDSIRLRIATGEELAIPKQQTTKVHLVYRWGGAGRDE